MISDRGAARWVRGHPWIFRSDVIRATGEAGIVPVTDQRGRFLGQALYSPSSEIRLRLLEPADRPVNRKWWEAQIGASAARREGIDATAWRAVYGEADGLPGLVVDRYDRWLVVQILSAGLVASLDDIVPALQHVLEPAGILFRNDAPVRQREGLPPEIRLARGAVPEDIEVREGSIRYLAAPWTGQKTGAFLDQRPARLRAG
ncbi:MAG: class I SAM-dependent rRNA methyltransferase, partial [Gemmatimonadales bacterium]